MRREDLEERLDTEVTVTLFDGSEYTGVLVGLLAVLLLTNQ